MTPPSENDDDWAELARELARDKPQPPAVPPELHHGFEGFPAAADDTLKDGDEPADGAPESESEEVADGQPGTGRKRRRRRRRRRKTGQPTDGPTTATSDSDEQDDSEEELAENDAVDAESGFEDEVDPDPDTDVMVGNEVESDEDAGGELLRELIANWSVPSWDEVVGSLYRPER